jgi:hypothetical protein
MTILSPHAPPLGAHGKMETPLKHSADEVLLYSRGYFVCERRGAVILRSVKQLWMSSFYKMIIIGTKKETMHIYIYSKISLFWDSITLFEKKIQTITVRIKNI